MRRTLATLVAVTAAALIAVLGASDSGTDARTTTVATATVTDPGWS
ncbi:hypothetical protein [Streptomyces justiciae]|uniref:Uncharacterized protein n=1 Tax=Streptomyces justiciae TaxID=2780140 RepID=A0ABU3M612_9ACTN|nr:hypothetical protein [Streptomyces justiciae]MBE8471366.1 hypothetical protein [Streptomyces justiciae]MDT7846957.1 hypothetical protein [Streptomyces justiciae]